MPSQVAPVAHKYDEGAPLPPQLYLITVVCCVNGDALRRGEKTQSVMLSSGSDVRGCAKVLRKFFQNKFLIHGILIARHYQETSEKSVIFCCITSKIVLGIIGE